MRIGEEDPLSEEEDMAVPGLVHRYPDRVLMQITDMCPMFCRHCTRKREWEEGNWARGDMEIERMVEYLSKTKQVRDVLISVLKNSKIGLTKEEIVKTVQDKRLVKENTILLNLQNRKVFLQFPCTCP